MPRGLYTALGQSLSKSKGLQRQAGAMESQKKLIQWEGKREREQMDEMLAAGVELGKIGVEIHKRGKEKKKVAAFAEEQGLTQQKDTWWKPAKWVNEGGTEVNTADILARGHFMEQENISKYGADWTSISPHKRRQLSKVAGDPERFKKEFYGTYDEESGETTYDEKYEGLSGEQMVKNYMAHGSFRGKPKARAKLEPGQRIGPGGEVLDAPAEPTTEQLSQIKQVKEAKEGLSNKAFRQIQFQKGMGTIDKDTDVREVFGNLSDIDIKELATEYDKTVAEGKKWEEDRPTMKGVIDDEGWYTDPITNKRVDTWAPDKGPTDPFAEEKEEYGLAQKAGLTGKFTPGHFSGYTTDTKDDDPMAGSKFRQFFPSKQKDEPPYTTPQEPVDVPFGVWKDIELGIPLEEMMPESQEWIEEWSGQKGHGGPWPKTSGGRPFFKRSPVHSILSGQGMDLWKEYTGNE